MRTLIFSDIHLTDKFNEKKFAFLKKIISQADQVIVNGDFWDGIIITFSQFIQSQWKDLFPLLKKKKTIYIYGNHDKKSLSDHRTSLFSIKQTERYILKSGTHTFIIEHGHRTEPKIFKQLDFLPKNRSLHVILNILFDKFEELIFDVLGKNTVQKKWYTRLNKETKLNIKKLVANGSIYVCGHTHAQEFDLKNHFINTGIVRHGLGQYLIIEGNKIELKEEWYA